MFSYQSVSCAELMTAENFPLGSVLHLTSYDIDQNLILSMFDLLADDVLILSYIDLRTKDKILER